MCVLCVRHIRPCRMTPRWLVSVSPSHQVLTTWKRSLLYYHSGWWLAKTAVFINQGCQGSREFSLLMRATRTWTQSCAGALSMKRDEGSPYCVIYLVLQKLNHDPTCSCPLLSGIWRKLVFGSRIKWDEWVIDSEVLSSEEELTGHNYYDVRHVVLSKLTLSHAIKHYQCFCLCAIHCNKLEWLKTKIHKHTVRPM